MIDDGTFVLILRMLVSLAIVLGLVVLFARWLESRGLGNTSRPRRATRASRAARPIVPALTLPGSGARRSGARHAPRPSRAARARRAPRALAAVRAVGAVGAPLVRMPRRADPEVTLEVLARTHLSRGSSVQVVRVGGQVLVLGVTDHGVRVLTDLRPADLEGDEPIVPGERADVGRRAVTATTAEQASEQGQAADAAAVQIFEDMLRREGRHRVAPHAADDEHR